MAPRGWPRKRVHHVAGKQISQPGRVPRSGLIGGLFGPGNLSQGHVQVAQAQSQSLQAFRGARHADQNSVQNCPATSHARATSTTSVNCENLQLQIPPSTKLVGHFTKLQEELQRCVSARPLVPPSRLLDAPAQVEQPRATLWSFARPSSSLYVPMVCGSAERAKRPGRESLELVDEVKPAESIWRFAEKSCWSSSESRPDSALEV